MTDIRSGNKGIKRWGESGICTSFYFFKENILVRHTFKKKEHVLYPQGTGVWGVCYSPENSDSEKDFEVTTNNQLKMNA